MSQRVCLEVFIERINVVEVAAGCPAGSAQRMKAEEERKSAEWSTMKRPWSYLILKMKRYWLYSRQPHTVCSASFKGLCVV